MKKIFMACALFLSLCCLGGCSKDNEPGSSKVKGKIEIDGKKVDLKYGYKFESNDFEDDDSGTEYAFYNIDMLKYADENGDIIEMPNTEWTGLAIMCIGHESTSISPVAIEVAYKIHPYKETGTSYEADVENTFNAYGSFSVKNGNVKCSAKSLPMEKYAAAGGGYQGVSEVTFSIDGKPLDVTGMYGDDDYSSRGIVITEVTDPKQIKALKSFMPSHHRKAK